MNLIARTIDGLSKVAIVLAGFILVYSTSHILLETVLRSVFAKSTQVLDEFVGFSILSITFLSLAWTLRSDAMIRVNILTLMLPKRAERIVDGIVSFTACALVVIACGFFWRNFTKDWFRGSVSESVAEVPLWIPQLIVFIGASLLALQLGLRVLTAFTNSIPDNEDEV